MIQLNVLQMEEINGGLPVDADLCAMSLEDRMVILAFMGGAMFGWFGAIGGAVLGYYSC